MLKTFSWCMVLVALATSCVDGADEEKTSEATAALITNPTEGGPFASNGTHWCSNQVGSYCYVMGGLAPKTTAGAVLTYLNNAALNWGCSTANSQPTGTVTGGFEKWYGTLTNGQACGRVYWNNAKQAAYFVPNAERQCNTANCNSPLPLNGTSHYLYAKYAALNWSDGVLGMPISNPVQYGWNNVTYQLFTGGVITFQNGQAAAYYAGGTGSRKAVTDKFLAAYMVSPTVGSPLYGLTKDINDMCLVAGQVSCTSIDDVGDVLVYFDAYWGANGYVVAKTSGSAYLVEAPIYTLWNNNIMPPIYNGGTPWSGSTYGFPTGNLVLLGHGGNGQEVKLQNFQNGSIVWQAKNCPLNVPACPGAGSMYCTTYGTLSTNLLASNVDNVMLCIL